MACESASVDYLPVWKKGATPFERLSELAEIARKHPERFSKFVICYKEVLPSGTYIYRQLQYGCELDEQIGMFEIGKVEALKESER